VGDRNDIGGDLVVPDDGAPVLPLVLAVLLGVAIWASRAGM
jgi:hypothetical protein